MSCNIYNMVKFELARCIEMNIYCELINNVQEESMYLVASVSIWYPVALNMFTIFNPSR